MRVGKIVQVGTFREMYEDPHDSFVAGFLGDPPISLLPCRYDAQTRRLTGDGTLEVALSGTTSALDSGQELLLGVRPEHVQVTSPGEPGAMQGRVSHFEPRLADRIKIVYVDLAPQLLAAKVPYETPSAVGDKIGIRLDPAGLFLFDPQTHRRLPLISPG
jgi:ABC-type sugar transport system ATPase subunit